MAAFLCIGALVAAGLWVGLLATPWQPWRTREQLRAQLEAGLEDPGSGVTAVVPARDEAEHITQTLEALRQQSSSLRIVVVDDQSRDETASLARAVPGVELVIGEPLPLGWTGKLWALHQGVARVETPLVMLVDADITLKPGVLRALRERQSRHDAGLVSVMAALAMASFWERLLMPAFIYFFKLIYPFALANGTHRHFHAAAGGCMLLRAEALDAVGGVASLRGAVIDDCTLAKGIKRAGYRTWVGLSREVISTRRYTRLGDTWAMVARTAYVQLGESVPALLACTAAMALSLIVPVVALALGSDWVTRGAALTALLAMAASYWPTVRYYGLPWPLAFTLAPVASLYLAMTWSSAWNSWRGVRARWKDREYEKLVIR